MTLDDLLLEIGSEAYSELTISERAALAGKYSVAQTRIAGLHAFQLLMKKFQPSYRMGKTYENLSEKFEAYRSLYNWYCQTVKAGKLTVTDTELDDVLTMDKDKFHPDAN